jgi:PEP-CTERM motif
MPRNFLSIALLAMIFLLANGSSQVAQADPITFNITNPNLTGSSGSVISLLGSFTNTTTAPLTFGLGINFPDGIDPAALFVSFEPGDALLQVYNGSLEFLTFTMTPGQTASGTLLSFTLGPNLKPGLLNLDIGFFTGNPSAPVLIGSGAFNINVTAAPVPEPATLLLIGTGLAGLAARIRSRKGKSTC